MSIHVVIEESSPRGRESVKRVSASYATTEEALETAKALIESGILEVWRRGMSVQALLKQWSARGEEVYVLPDNGEPCFSSSDYAKDFAGELTARGGLW